MTKPAAEQEKTQKSGAFAVPDPSTLKPPCYDRMSVEELAKHDGTDTKLGIYVAMKGIVFDVSSKREVYGPGGSYHVFAGKDASRAFGKSSLDRQDAVADYSTLTEDELKVLNEWESFFKKRYSIVGTVAAQ